MSFLSNFDGGRREPLTPAQKKIVAGVACIALIITCSIALDAVIERDRAYMEPVAEQQSPAKEGPKDGTAADSDGEGDAQDDEAGSMQQGGSDGGDPAAEGVADSGSLAAGKSVEAEGFTVENGTGEPVSVDMQALETAIGALIGETGAAGGVHATFTVIGAGSNSNVESVYLRSTVSGLEYIRAYRDNGAPGYAIASFGSQTVWLALMEADGIDTSQLESPAQGADEGDGGAAEDAPSE